MTDELVHRAKAVPRFKKEKFLLTLSEDDFRDRVVRPLLLRRGLLDGRDLCGPREKGKDTYFLVAGPLGTTDVYVLQTKKGNLNLARKASGNVVEATTQLKTALATRVIVSPTKERRFPSKAILCASGKINDMAREHITDEVKDPRVEFLDVDDLIPLLDEAFPELWFDIEPELRPYLRALRRNVQDAEEDILPGEGGRGASSAISDGSFVTLHLRRTFFKLKKRSGQVERVPAFEELPVQKVIDRSERLILMTGEAGTGKSTTLRRLAYVLAENSLREPEARSRVPVLLRASLVSSSSDTPLLDICVQETSRLSGGLKPIFSAEDLEEGRVTIFIDALDELADDVARTHVLTKIEEFHRAYAECQIIVTSRDYAFVRILPALNAFTRFRLTPISYRQAEQILKRVHGHGKLPVASSQEVLRRLQEVHGLQLSPLLVTVFAATSDFGRRDIPANITELFKKYTEMMLGRWDAGKGVAQQYQAPLKDFILCQIAFEMHRREVTTLGVEEFRRLVAIELQRRGHEASVDQLTDEIVYRSGLFRIIAGEIEFRHLLLQEFFAGRGIPAADFLESVISNDWWQRSIVFYFGQHPGDSKALESIRNAVAPRPIEEQFRAALALGLALQACYLVEVTDKIEILKWVVAALSAAKGPYIDALIAEGVRPLTAFIWYYVFGREAVACNLPESTRSDAREQLIPDGLLEDDSETRLFWLAVSLIECSHVEEAETLIRKFRPDDTRLLLGIYLGCFLLETRKVSSKEERSTAESIRRRLEERIQPLRKLLREELKSEIVELYKGTVRALPETGSRNHQVPPSDGAGQQD